MRIWSWLSLLNRQPPRGRRSRRSFRRGTERLPSLAELSERLESRELLSSTAMRVTDFTPSPDSEGSKPNQFIEVSGTTFFVAETNTTGRELWRTDGTDDGTWLVKDIRAGNGDGVGGQLTNVNGTLFFAASDGVHGLALWKSDGTNDGTVMVMDIRPGGMDGGDLSSFTNLNGTLLFAANSGDDGFGLWKSDGTTTGTVLVKNARTSPSEYDIDPDDVRNLTAVGNTLFFEMNDGMSGGELWKSDGTESGTVRVKDIRPGSATSEPRSMANINGKLFFTTDIFPEEWSTSDGTPDGIVKVTNLTGEGWTNIEGKLDYEFQSSNERWWLDNGVPVLASIGDCLDLGGSAIYAKSTPMLNDCA